MKIELTREDKIELLKAVQRGILDTLRVPSLFQCLEGANAFEECMKVAFREDDETPLPPKSDSLTAEAGESLYLSEN